MLTSELVRYARSYNFLVFQDKQLESAPTDPPADSLVIDEVSPDLEEPDENEVIDNKYRLRKLLEQCSTEEIRSVLLPEAFDSINIGDFLLYKVFVH